MSRTVGTIVKGRDAREPLVSAISQLIECAPEPAAVRGAARGTWDPVLAAQLAGEGSAMAEDGYADRGAPGAGRACMKLPDFAASLSSIRSTSRMASGFLLYSPGTGDTGQNCSLKNPTPRSLGDDALGEGGVQRHSASRRCGWN